jgi:hypothetical protein
LSATGTSTAALICTVSVLAACAGRSAKEEPRYRPVLLTQATDPLAPARDFPAWRPPRQFAVYVHPHEDRSREVLVGGHWILLLLGEGSWYTEETADREPVPDAEASEEDLRKGLSALGVPGDAVVPYRKKE